MNRPNPARLLLIDDHRIFNDALVSLLSTQPDLMICGQVFDAADALPAIQRTSPHLILLDINLHHSNGIDLGKTIMANFPAVRILMLTMYNQTRLMDESRRAGLHGYMLKEAKTADLLRGIRAVLANETHFVGELANKAAPTDDAFGDEFARRLNLSFREVEVVALVREGLNNEQIAARMHISVETVKTHRKNIHFKLGITKVTDLIQFALRHGI